MQAVPIVVDPLILILNTVIVFILFELEYLIAEVTYIISIKDPQASKGKHEEGQANFWRLEEQLRLNS